MEFSELLDLQPTETLQAKRTCGLVVGMHRSGTSCVAGTLSLLGLTPPANLMGADKSNPKGHWESNPVAELNDRILEFADSHWTDWQPFNENWYDTPYFPSFVNEARQVLSAEFADGPMIVLKDPRICRLTKFWLNVLDTDNVDPVIFMPFREPLEVIRSLNTRGGFQAATGEFVWLRYVLDAERGTRGRLRFIFSYVDFVADWRSVILRAQQVLGVQFPELNPATSTKIDGFIDADLYRNRAVSVNIQSPQLGIWASAVRDILSRWSQQGEDSNDHEELDRINADFSRYSEMFAPLWASSKHLDEENSQLARDLLRRQVKLEEAQADLDVCNSGMRELQRQEGELRQSLKEHMQQVEALTAELAILQVSKMRMSRIVQKLITERMLPPSRGVGIRTARWRKYKRQLASEGIFHEMDYLAKNPDVAATGTDSLVHYLEFGFQEGRDFDMASKSCDATNERIGRQLMQRDISVASSNIDNDIRPSAHLPISQHEDGVPKFIWMLWLQGWDNAPEIARISRDCWARRNPDWCVQALTLETLCQFLPDDVIRDFTQTPKPPEALANLIRIELLYRHGGVWTDATTLCAVPLDDWLADAMHTGFFALAQPGPDRMISNWFLAASKGSIIIRDWRYEGLEYWKGRAERDIYFWHHRCFAWAYQKSSEFRELWDASPKIPANNQFHFGPDSVELLAQPDKNIEDLLANPPVPVFKLTNKLASCPDELSLYNRLIKYGKE